MSSRSEVGKVYWSDVEKLLIIKNAVAIQKTRPDLAGLPLLREAVRTLPQDRRRKIVTLSQVEWFEPGIEAEARQAKSLTNGESNSIEALIVGYPEDMKDPWTPFFLKMIDHLSAIRDLLVIAKLNREDICKIKKKLGM